MKIVEYQAVHLFTVYNKPDIQGLIASLHGRLSSEDARSACGVVVDWRKALRLLTNEERIALSKVFSKYERQISRLAWVFQNRRQVFESFGNIDELEISGYPAKHYVEADRLQIFLADIGGAVLWASGIRDPRKTPRDDNASDGAPLRWTDVHKR
jgi:hypothetical protein